MIALRVTAEAPGNLRYGWQHVYDETTVAIQLASQEGARSLATLILVDVRRAMHDLYNAGVVVPDIYWHVEPDVPSQWCPPETAGSRPT